MSNTVERKEYIGGSDSAKLMQEHRFGGPKDVYDKVSPQVDYTPEDLSENRDIMRGNMVEPIAFDQIQNEYPSLNSTPVRDELDSGGGIGGQIFLQHPENPYVAGHPDGLSMDPFDDSVIVHEIKAPRSSSISRIRKQGIPSRYFYQVQHYMGIVHEQTDSEVKGIVWPFSCDDWEPFPIQVQFREDLWSDMSRLYQNFWQRVVVEDETWDSVNEDLFGGENEKAEVYESEKMSDMLAEYYEIRSTYKEKKDDMKSLKTEILSNLNGESRIEGDTHYATVKEYSNSTHLTVREKTT